jgi:hypothetical protein
MTSKDLNPVLAPVLALCAMTLVAPMAEAAAAGARVEMPRPQGKPRLVPSGDEDRHAHAVQSFRAGRYADAYGRFAGLADEGHAPSALMALAMVCEGPTTFGSEWSATPGQLLRWSALAMREATERRLAIPDHDRGE